jgi:hypothetical protein
MMTLSLALTGVRHIFHFILSDPNLDSPRQQMVGWDKLCIILQPYVVVLLLLVPEPDDGFSSTSYAPPCHCLSAP